MLGKSRKGFVIGSSSLAAFFFVGGCFGFGNPTPDDFARELTTFMGPKVEVKSVESCEHRSADVGTARLYTENDKDVVECLVTFVIILPGIEDLAYEPPGQSANVTMAKAKTGVWRLVDLKK